MNNYVTIYSLNTVEYLNNIGLFKKKDILL